MNKLEDAKAKMQKYMDYQNNIFLWNYDKITDIVILNELTVEKPYGWVFYWQEKNVLDDMSNFVIGNSPVLIEKETLDMYALKTGISLEENLLIYFKNKENLGKLEMDEWGNFDIVNI